MSHAAQLLQVVCLHYLRIGGGGVDDFDTYICLDRLFNVFLLQMVPKVTCFGLRFLALVEIVNLASVIRDIVLAYVFAEVYSGFMDILS